VQKWQGTAMASGDLKANIPVLLVFDGTNWQIDTIGNAPAGGGGVTSFTGDGTLINNSGSTGAVTATLANAAAHKFWGNNTGSSAAPGYQSLGSQDVSVNEYAAGGGSAQAQTVTLSPALTSYVAGEVVRWLPTAANTGSGPTLNVNGLGTKTITKCGTNGLVANDLTTTQIAGAIYDGTEFILQNPASGGCVVGIWQSGNASGTSVSSGTTNYFSVSSPNTSPPTTNTSCPLCSYMPRAGTVKSIYVYDVALANTSVVTVTVENCGSTAGACSSPTAGPTCAITGTAGGGAQTCNNSTDLAFAAGDFLTVQAAVTVAATGATSRWIFEITYQ